jgi:hypothetical protein
MHPSLIAGEDHSVISLEGRNLEVEAMVITIKNSDASLAELLVGWVRKNKMSIWCLVAVLFFLFNPDIALILWGIIYGS